MCAHRPEHGWEREWMKRRGREREREKTLKFIPEVHLLVLYPIAQLCTYLLSQNKDSIIKWLESWAWGKKSGTHPPEGSLSSFGQWEENNHSGLWDHFPFISSSKSPISPILAHQSLREFAHYLQKEPCEPDFPTGSSGGAWLSKNITWNQNHTYVKKWASQGWGWRPRDPDSV